MVNTTRELSEYRLSKAKQDLLAAKLLFDNNHFAQSLNRSYYAIFHAVRSLLAYDKFDSKKHSGIISYFINKCRSICKCNYTAFYFPSAGFVNVFNRTCSIIQVCSGIIISQFNSCFTAEVNRVKITRT